jgi:transcription-repair coupling factor (superfamily II helicase)
MAVAAWLEALADDPVLARLAAAVEAGGETIARGQHGSSASLVAGALALRLSARTLLLVVAHLDDADEAVAELVGAGLDAVPFPALEALPGESAVGIELVAARISTARRLDGAAAERPRIVVAPIAALMQRLPSRERFDEVMRTIRPGDRIDLRALAAWLERGGYRRVEAIETAGEFAIRGGIVDVFAPGAGTPIRIDLFGDEVERVFEVDLATQASDRALPRAELVSASAETLRSDRESLPLWELLPRDAIVVLSELAEVVEQARGYYERVHDSTGIDAPPRVLKGLAERAASFLRIDHFGGSAQGRAGDGGGGAIDLPVGALPIFSDEVKDAFVELAGLGARYAVTVFCDTAGEAQRTRELLGEHASAARISIVEAHLHRGFLWGGNDLGSADSAAIAFVPQREILHRYGVRRRGVRLGGGQAREAFTAFAPGDFVVHRDHGIARFLELRTMPTERGDGAGSDEAEFLTLEFDGGAKLHVPMAKVELVQKYIGAGAARPILSTLGGKRWRNARENVQEAVRDLAAELLRVQAARETMPGIRYPDDTPWQREFEAEFPYEETEDQLAAIDAVKRDMTRPRPMDRLICGDVGFGKTEVAIRAAFKAVEFGKQVAVLVPTTVLAEQHERTFRDRFRAYPFRVESLSRFKTDAEQRKLLDELGKGRIDVVIGTHRLVSKDVRFSDLGLVIIDEEQRFGVEHKNRLLELRMTADVLTLSATPIPRTLHMAMLGLRDISNLTTAPLDRRAIVTEVIPFNQARVQQAIVRELAREGQVFIIHNRVHDILSFADRIRRLVPDARIAIGHGQMPPKELEAVMLRFMRREADILVSTTIIESGIDIPTANTILINNAHMFGLAELHQLRGRVGRWKHRAYCYLLLPEHRTIPEDAMKRLKAIEDYSMLGAGFRIAMRDLEIRGAGNILGPEQSGHIAAVGYEMYCQLLEQAVGELKNERKMRPVDVAIDLGFAGAITKGYIPSDQRRMEAYRRIGQADSLEALAKVRADIVGAYGEPPATTERLFEIAEVRLRAMLLGVRSLQRREQDIVFRTAKPRDLEAAFRGVHGSVRIVGQPDAEGVTEVYFRPPPAFLKPRSLLAVLRKRLAP